MILTFVGAVGGRGAPGLPVVNVNVELAATVTVSVLPLTETSEPCTMFPAARTNSSRGENWPFDSRAMGGRAAHSTRGLVSLTFASWNRITMWLNLLADLREVA
jgi:hypothetical protein